MVKYCPFTPRNPGELVGQQCAGSLCAMYSGEHECCAPLAVLKVMTAQKPKTPRGKKPEAKG